MTALGYTLTNEQQAAMRDLDEIKSVSFYLSEFFFRQERGPPYDFNGGTVDKAMPWDSSETQSASAAVQVK